jgi:hypothetical protein
MRTLLEKFGEPLAKSSSGRPDEDDEEMGLDRATTGRRLIGSGMAEGGWGSLRSDLINFRAVFP